MTLSDRVITVRVSDEEAGLELLYIPPDEPHDSAHFYVSVKDWSKYRGETIIELTTADMFLIYDMLAEALGQDKEVCGC